MDYLENETEECSYCDFTIKIKDMDMKNWYNGAYFCDSCFTLIENNELKYIYELDMESN